MTQPASLSLRAALITLAKADSALATAMGGQDTLARLQTQAALSGGGVYDALGSGLASATNTQPNMNNLLAQYLQKQMGV